MDAPALKRERESEGELCQTAKKLKCDVEGEPSGHGEAEYGEKNVLSGFKTIAVLRDSALEKTIFLHGKVIVMSAHWVWWCI